MGVAHAPFHFALEAGVFVVATEQLVEISLVRELLLSRELLRTNAHPTGTVVGRCH